jgi:hypothetical protein
MLGAKLNAEAASFAPFFNDVNNAVRHLNAFSVQGLSPVGHRSSSFSIPH